MRNMECVDILVPVEEGMPRWLVGGHPFGRDEGIGKERKVSRIEKL